MRRSLFVAFFFGLWSLTAAPFGLADGVFQSVIGDVRAAVGTAAPVKVANGQQVVPGMTITTGPGAQTIIRFDDGHTIVLNENTEFRVNQYNFEKNKPQYDNIALQLLRGALRSVTGLIGSRSHAAFALTLPQATIGIRGTDFMVALVNPAYLSVLRGEIGITNAAGTKAFSAGSTATVASSTALAVSIPASALPPSVASIFGNLSSIPISGEGAWAGAGAATGAATGGITADIIAGGAAIVGVAAAASSSNSSGNSTSTTTTAAAP